MTKLHLYGKCQQINSTNLQSKCGDVGTLRCVYLDLIGDLLKNAMLMVPRINEHVSKRLMGPAKIKQEHSQCRFMVCPSGLQGSQFVCKNYKLPIKTSTFSLKPSCQTLESILRNKTIAQRGPHRFRLMLNKNKCKTITPMQWQYSHIYFPSYRNPRLCVQTKIVKMSKTFSNVVQLKIKLFSTIYMTTRVFWSYQ